LTFNCAPFGSLFAAQDSIFAGERVRAWGPPGGADEIAERQAGGEAVDAGFAHGAEDAHGGEILGFEIGEDFQRIEAAQRNIGFVVARRRWR